jgi:hypothetical protein
MPNAQPVLASCEISFPVFEVTTVLPNKIASLSLMSVPPLRPRHNFPDYIPNWEFLCGQFHQTFNSCVDLLSGPE